MNLETYRVPSKNTRQVYISLRIRNSNIASTINGYLKGLKESGRLVEPQISRRKKIEMPTEKTPRFKPPSINVSSDSKMVTPSKLTKSSISLKRAIKPLVSIIPTNINMLIPISGKNKSIESPHLSNKTTRMPRISRGTFNASIKSPTRNSNTLRVLSANRNSVYWSNTHSDERVVKHNKSKEQTTLVNSYEANDDAYSYSRIPSNSSRKSSPVTDKLKSRLTHKFGQNFKEPRKSKYTNKIAITEEALNFIEDYFNRPSYSLLKLKQRKFKMTIFYSILIISGSGAKFPFCTVGVGGSSGFPISVFEPILIIIPFLLIVDEERVDSIWADNLSFSFLFNSSRVSNGISPSATVFSSNSGVFIEGRKFGSVEA